MVWSTVQVLRNPQAQERQHLTLFRHPIKTLYYFSKFVIRGSVNGTRWFVSHPLTIFLLVPALLAYLFAKQLDYAPTVVQHIEVIAALAFYLAKHKQLNCRQLLL
jgi:hypothetical protein